eukprot:364522-Rhodomonas_salina.1
MLRALRDHPPPFQRTVCQECVCACSSVDDRQRVRASDAESGRGSEELRAMDLQKLALFRSSPSPLPL